MQNEKYLGRYRNGTIRLQSWNYGCNGYYFITICTKYRQDYFGEVINGKMVLNKIGKIVNKYWVEIPNHFKNVKLDEFIVMPDHVHGILFVNNNPRGCAINRAPTGKSTNIRIGGITGNKNPMLYQNISTMIRWYKGRCTFEINEKYPQLNFVWQSRFWDRVIRNYYELERIRWYIKNNPVVWG